MSKAAHTTRRESTTLRTDEGGRVCLEPTAPSRTREGSGSEVPCPEGPGGAPMRKHSVDSGLRAEAEPAGSDE